MSIGIDFRNKNVAAFPNKKILHGDMEDLTIHFSWTCSIVFPSTWSQGQRCWAGCSEWMLIILLIAGHFFIAPWTLSSDLLIRSRTFSEVKVSKSCKASLRVWNTSALSGTSVWWHLIMLFWTQAARLSLCELEIKPEMCWRKDSESRCKGKEVLESSLW